MASLIWDQAQTIKLYPSKKRNMASPLKAATAGYLSVANHITPTRSATHMLNHQVSRRSVSKRRYNLWDLQNVVSMHPWIYYLCEGCHDRRNSLVGSSHMHTLRASISREAAHLMLGGQSIRRNHLRFLPHVSRSSPMHFHRNLSLTKLKGDNTTRRHRNPCCWLYYRLYRTFHRLSGCIITDVSLYPHQLITSVQSSPRFLMLQDLTTIGTQFCGRRPFRQSWWSTLLDNITLSYPSAFPAVVVPFLKPINGPTTLMDGQHPLSLDTDSDPFMFPINRWWHIPSRNGARVSTSPHRRTNTRNIAVANIQSNVLGDILPAIREQAQYEPIAEEHVRCLESPNQTWSTSYMLPRWRDALEKERELPHTEWWLLYDLYRASSILQIVGENCILPLFVSSSLSCRFAWKPARSRMRWCLDMALFDGILGFQPNEWSIVLSLCNIESNPQYRWNDIHLILYLVNRPEDHRRQTSSFGIGLLPITKIICMVILVSTAIDPYMRP